MIADAVDRATANAGREVRIHDHHRPQYHYLPPAGWMNDPNGLIQWDGQYHLFYQYNPEGAYHDWIQWGHAISDDLVHWRDLPIALTPEVGEYDQDGCWSGCAIDAEGTPMIFYSGVQPQVVNIATGSDDLVEWEKYEGNPVIAAPPAGIDSGVPWQFRDPYVWHEDDIWYMLMGSRVEDAGGMLLLYRSANLTDWEYLHPLMVGDAEQPDPFWTGTMWECPNLLRIGDRYLLLVSIQGFTTDSLLYTAYYTGAFADGEFTPATEGILEYGGYAYAPQVMHDDRGRWLYWSWLREARSERSRLEAGWAGVMSLPRVLTLGPDGSVRSEPAPELQALRGRHWRVENLELTSATQHLLREVQGGALELIAEFDVGTAEGVGVKVACSPDGKEETLIVYDTVRQRLTVDRTHSSLDPEAHPEVLAEYRQVEYAPIVLDAGEPLRLHIFLDRSVLEVFVNGVCYTTRIYPSREDSIGVDVFARGGNVLVNSVDVWKLASIWPTVDDEGNSV